MKERAFDLLDGYDNGEYVYNEKAEKQYHAGVWFAVACCIVAVLLWGIFLHVQEICLKVQGNCIVAEYDAERMSARYEDENRRVHLYRLGSYYPEYEGDTVRLYYRHNIAAAVPAQSWIFWLCLYGVFGGALFFCIFRIVRIYKKKHKSGGEH